MTDAPDTPRLPDAAAPLAGACRCGALRMALTAPPFMTAACHCDGCRRMSASAFSLTMMVPDAAFRVTAGSPVPAGAGTPGLTHYACPDCHSWVFTRVTGADFVNLRSALFDDPAWTRPYMETQLAEALPWMPALAPRRFDRFPDPSDFGALVAGFAAERL